MLKKLNSHLKGLKNAEKKKKKKIFLPHLFELGPKKKKRHNHVQRCSHNHALKKNNLHSKEDHKF